MLTLCMLCLTLGLQEVAMLDANQDDWPSESLKWPGYLDLGKTLQGSDTEEPLKSTGLKQIVDSSNQFPIKFPIESVRCHSLETKIAPEFLEKNINSVYPLVHERALNLYVSFLVHKRKFGSAQERELYQNMTLVQFVDRLLRKRAVAFVGVMDSYLLLDGTRGEGRWETVGMPEEKSPLTLSSYLSYDEIKLSALLSVSSYTYFVNNGTRFNRGVYDEDRTKIQDGGVIIGLIGARLEKANVMEFREVMKTREQNVHQYGYGQFFAPTTQGLFLNFYGDVSLTYPELEQRGVFDSGDRFVDLKNRTFFDTLLYSRRIALSIDTLLIEANDRAKNEKAMAYVHVVGIGLGVWQIYEGQVEIFMDTFAKRLEFLGKNLSHISDICFAYIKHKQAGKYKDGDKVPIEDHSLGGIKLHMRNREPHEKLVGDDKDKLLVVSYAWDGNALPGNEFWYGDLSSSGDPAAASSTQVAEIHNPHINPNVAAANLRVATLSGLVSFKKFQEIHKND